MEKIYLHRLCAEISASCLAIDEWVRRECGHEDFRNLIKECHANLDETDPSSYLIKVKTVGVWDMYFQEVLLEWDADNKLSAQRYNYIIERLSKNAAQLDELVPQLEEELARREYLDSTRLMVTNAVEMQSCLNSFLNSADEGLNYWKHQEGTTVTQVN
jgi:hypothetical protein